MRRVQPASHKNWQMTSEEKKLNAKYFKLLAEYAKVNSRAKHIKMEMQQIRAKIIPCENLTDERPDEAIMKVV